MSRIMKRPCPRQSWHVEAHLTERVPDPYKSWTEARDWDCEYNPVTRVLLCSQMGIQ